MEDIFHQYLFPLATRLFELIAQFKRSATAEERNFLLCLLKSYVIGYVRDLKSPLTDTENLISNVRCPATTV
jgi:hypothetical protein